MPQQPAPLVWEIRSGQTYISNTEGIFAIKHICITRNDLVFFYACTSLNMKEPYIVAITLLDAGIEGSIQTTLETTVQPLGTIGIWNVGIIHVKWIDRPEQQIQLSIFPHAGMTSVWQITPLKQLYIPNEVRWLYDVSIPIAPQEVEEVEFYIARAGKEIAFFRLHEQYGTVPNASPIFLRIEQIDGNVKVVLLSQDEYIFYASRAVNPTTLHVDFPGGSDELHRPSSALRPSHRENRRKQHMYILRPLLWQRSEVQWPQGFSSGGNGAMEYWDGAFTSSIDILTLATSYEKQLQDLGWTCTKEYTTDTLIWRAWTFRSKTGEPWNCFFLFATNPGTNNQCKLYVHADKVGK